MHGQGETRNRRRPGEVSRLRTTTCSLGGILEQKRDSSQENGDTCTNVDFLVVVLGDGDVKGLWGPGLLRRPTVRAT